VTCESQIPATLTASIHAGAVSPYSVKYDVTTDDPDFDLTLVATARFDVLREGSGALASWSAVVSAKTTTSLRLTHIFSSGDVPEADVLLLEPRLTLAAGGEVVCQVAKLVVRRKFE
jgi:hypothetical protein